MGIRVRNVEASRSQFIQLRLAFHKDLLQQRRMMLKQARVLMEVPVPIDKRRNLFLRGNRSPAYVIPFGVQRHMEAEADVLPMRQQLRGLGKIRTGRHNGHIFNESGLNGPGNRSIGGAAGSIIVGSRNDPPHFTAPAAIPLIMYFCAKT
ncbi:Uncharacterised protein [Actinobacillus pleuropneumoniae]|nr:Uncharacterised protein [Actinobacillus pleuropneumoniae]